MKKIFQVFILFAGLSALVAQADIINITVDAAGSLLNNVGIANNTQYGQANNNPESNLAFLTTEIGYWNNVFDPDLPAALGPVAANFGSLDDATSHTTLAGYDYVVFHFGAGSAGGGGVSPGGWWQAYYLGGEGGVQFFVPTIGDKTVGGFSSARYFNGPSIQVPDGGATLVLLGLAMVGIAVASRQSKVA